MKLVFTEKERAGKRVRSFNIYPISIPTEDNEGNGRETILEKIIAEKFPNSRLT